MGNKSFLQQEINGSAQLVDKPPVTSWVPSMYTISSFQTSSLVDQQRAGEMIAAKNG